MIARCKQNIFNTNFYNEMIIENIEKLKMSGEIKNVLLKLEKIFPT